MPLVHTETGHVLTDEQGLDRLRRTIERTGQLLMCADNPVPVGSVRHICGVPFRCVRLASRKEYIAHEAACNDIWPERWGPMKEGYFFEVVVAD